MDSDVLEEMERTRTTVTIVEGKKDRVALASFGFQKIVTLENTPLYAVVESLPEKKVMILTDLDRKGKELYRRLARLCAKRGIFVDNALRLLLFKARVSHIEGLHKPFADDVCRVAHRRIYQPCCEQKEYRHDRKEKTCSP